MNNFLLFNIQSKAFCATFAINTINMRTNKSLIWSFVLLTVVAAVYRVFPDRAFGFAPHWAMALFGGAMIKDKKWAFALPLFSMFLSDMLFHALYVNGVTDTPGFYKGQLVNYALFAGVTCIGFLMRKPITVMKVLGYSLLGPTAFFVASNFILWANGGGYQRAKTVSGLLQCYTDGLPFYRGSLAATVIFSAVLFGGYYLINKGAFKARVA